MFDVGQGVTPAASTTECRGVEKMLSLRDAWWHGSHMWKGATPIRRVRVKTLSSPAQVIESREEASEETLLSGDP